MPRKFMVVAVGWRRSLAHTVTLPGPVAPVATTLRKTAFASAGTLHWPRTAIWEVVATCNGCPGPVRESNSRHGVVGVKLDGTCCAWTPTATSDNCNRATAILLFMDPPRSAPTDHRPVRASSYRAFRADSLPPLRRLDPLRLLLRRGMGHRPEPLSGLRLLAALAAAHPRNQQRRGRADARRACPRLEFGHRGQRIPAGRSDHLRGVESAAIYGGSGDGDLHRCLEGRTLPPRLCGLALCLGRERHLRHQLDRPGTEADQQRRTLRRRLHVRLQALPAVHRADPRLPGRVEPLECRAAPGRARLVGS